MLAATVVLGGCSGLVSAGSPTPTATEIATAPAAGQTVSGSGYNFAAPEGWSVPNDMSLPGVDVIVADMADADGFTDNINVVLSPSGMVTPDQAESLGVGELEAGGASDVKKRNRVMVAGSESAHLSGSLSSGGADYQIEQFSVSSDGQTYVVTFSFSPTVPESDRDDLSESVLATWTWG